MATTTILNNQNHQHPHDGRNSQQQVRQFSRKASSRQWLDRHVKDPFVQKAQENGKISRSYYKLEFMDKKYGLFKSILASAKDSEDTKDTTKTSTDKKGNIVIVDLGAAPGGWTQYVSEQEHPSYQSQVLAIDLLELDLKIASLPNVHFVQGDFTKLVQLDNTNHLPLLQPFSTTPSDKNEATMSSSVHMVLSDMAPNFIGDSRSDAIRTAELCLEALEFSLEVTLTGGMFCGKFFSGPEEIELKAMARSEYEKVFVVKPPASRMESAERYLVAMNRRGEE